MKNPGGSSNIKNLYGERCRRLYMKNGLEKFFKKLLTNSENDVLLY